MKKEQRRKKGHCELLLWNIPKDLKQQFKLKCLQQGVTMRDKVVTLIQESLNAR